MTRAAEQATHPDEDRPFEPDRLEHNIPDVCQGCGETVGAAAFLVLAFTLDGVVQPPPGAPHWQAARVAGLASFGLEMQGDGLAACPKCGAVETLSTMVAAKRAEIVASASGLRPFFVRFGPESAIVWAGTQNEAQQAVRDTGETLRIASARRRILARACRGMKGAPLADFATAAPSA